MLLEINLKRILKYNLNILEKFGYIQPEFNTKIKTNLYKIYALIFITFSFITFSISEICNMIKVFGDIEAMTEASFLLLTHIDEGIKLIYLIKYAPRVRKLITSFNRYEFMPKNSEQEQILVDLIQTSNRITLIFLILGVLTCCLWGIFPLIDAKSDIISLPLSGWYPFNTDKSPIFEIIYVYQIIGALINALVNISIDTFMSATIMVISGQLTLLNHSLKNMGREESLKFDTNLDQAMRKNLVVNINHHRNIIEFSNEVIVLFSTPILWQFTISGIIICMTMFQMSLLPVISIQFFSMAIYQICMLLEIFLLCYYGNEVFMQSIQLTESAYFCDWLDCSIEFKRNLLFFMIRSQFPTKLYAGNFFTLSSETFVKVLKTSYSYFAVLNHVNE